MAGRNFTGFLCLLLALIPGVALDGQAAQATAERRAVRGVVFEDVNGNGLRDAGEPGVAGVAVSDQYIVARTGGDGSYELAADTGAQVVFVSLSDGWVARGLFWRPLGAGGSQQHDFALRRAAVAADFDFVHASDTHLDQASLPRMQKLRELVEKRKPAFVILTGDLVRDALRVNEAQARACYDLLVAELAKFPVPVWTVPGNHENFGIERHLSLVSPSHPLYGKKMYRHYLGPNYFSFTYGGVHFVGLDSVDISDLWYYGHVDKAQLDWLGRDLESVAAGTPVVTFNHIPFASSVEGLAGYMEDGAAPSVIKINGKLRFRHVVSNTADVLAAVRKNHRLEIALGGHFHSREAIRYEIEGQSVRFFQTSAVVGPNPVPGMKMASGVTLYRVRSGKVDDGTFLPLD